MCVWVGETEKPREAEDEEEEYERDDFGNSPVPYIRP